MQAGTRSRRVLVVVLLLVCAATPALEAQQFLCWPIAPGDTASGLALQLTSDPAAAYSPAFQIRDPARQLFVPKSQYRRLSANWQACVATGQLKATAIAPSGVIALAGPVVDPLAPPIGLPPAASRTRSVLAPTDDFVFIAKIAALVLTLLIVVAVGASLRPRPIPPVMLHAGEKFVRVFAEPLVDPSSSVPPVHARLRFVRRKEQLEIFIAPGAGRRYPNLVDHKLNVEYDVTRVMRALGNQFVVSDRLRAEGAWLVVPIRATGQKKTGVT